MKKILLVISHVLVAVVSGVLSIIVYNTLLLNRVIDDSHQLEVRAERIKLNYRKAQLELDAQAKTNYIKHEEEIEDLRQREREMAIRWK